MALGLISFQLLVNILITSEKCLRWLSVKIHRTIKNKIKRKDELEVGREIMLLRICWLVGCSELPASQTALSYLCHVLLQIKSLILMLDDPLLKTNKFFN